MFTGIITDTTTVRASRPTDAGVTLTFGRPETWTDLVLGESVAVNGACLTVSAIRPDELTVS